MVFSFIRIILEDTELAVYKRGLNYFQKKSVDGAAIGAAAYKATVQGSQPYTVTLGFTRMGSPQYRCTCPYYIQNKLACKHIIASALTWDDERSVPPPSLNDTEALCIPPPEVTFADVNKSYTAPLNTDLNVLRLAADNLGHWSRPHARLPDKPRACQKQLSSVEDFLIARKQLLAWVTRRGYDMYFCAGEMEAGFCEMLRWLTHAFPVLSISDKLKVLEVAIALHHEILQGVDDSDGLHVFGEAHLFSLCDIFQKDISTQDEGILKQLRKKITDY